MGWCNKYVKPVIREFREEITQQVFAGATNVALHFTEAIADGDLTKEEAGKLGEDALKIVYGISTGGARVVLAAAVRAVNKLEAAGESVELEDDDTADADAALA